MKKLTLILTALSLAALTACGQKDAPAPAVAATPAPAVVATAPAADNPVGKSIYGKTCSLCHAAAIAGAPKPGDKAEWGPRIAQGKEVLYKHAIEGFTGAKGMMPARGGGTTLTDDEVKAAVDYMADQSV